MIPFGPGESIGAYRIVRLLGEGGMGVVYEVEHRELGIRYALKVFSSDSGDASLRSRFIAEGRVLARLRHPNLVRVYDLGIEERTGASYYVMDLLLGDDGNPHSLAESAGEVPDEDTLVRWFSEVASALDYVHEHGVVHRDVKPSNLLLSAGGHVVLSDFGVSRFFSESLNAAVGAVRTMVCDTASSCMPAFGTRGFIAPEVLEGSPATPAADVYSLGVVFVYLLTGMWYERGSQVMRMLETFERPWQSVLPPMLGRAEDRPAKLVAHAELLLAIPDDPPVVPSAAVSARRWHRKLVLLVVLSAVAAGGLWFWLDRAKVRVPHRDYFSSEGIYEEDS